MALKRSGSPATPAVKEKPEEAVKPSPTSATSETAAAVSTETAAANSKGGSTEITAVTSVSPVTSTEPEVKTEVITPVTPVTPVTITEPEPEVVLEVTPSAAQVAAAEQIMLDALVAVEEAKGVSIPTQTLVLVRNLRSSNFRQPSTEKWIEGKGTAYLLDDGWLRNQINADLLELVEED